jgi:hypothetical protein
VSAGVGVAIVPETAQYTDYHGVRFMPSVDMQDDLIFELSILWVPDGITRLLRTLIECFGKASSASVRVKRVAERSVPAFASGDLKRAAATPHLRRAGLRSRLG